MTESCCIILVLHIYDLRSFSFSPSTTIRNRIRIWLNTAVNYLVFGQILKTHI